MPAPLSRRQVCTRLPDARPGLAHAINQVLGALLFVTFLQVPAADLVRSLRAGQFLGAALTVDFGVVPARRRGDVPVPARRPGTTIRGAAGPALPLYRLVIVFSGRTVSAAAGTKMVPLMVATLLTVVASQVPKLDDNHRRSSAAAARRC
nr:hypothetical protein [Pseudofrankia asymbiotica]